MIYTITRGIFIYLGSVAAGLAMHFFLEEIGISADDILVRVVKELRQFRRRKEQTGKFFEEESSKYYSVQNKSMASYTTYKSKSTTEEDSSRIDSSTNTSPW
ncbi:hypothetical protein QYM36_006528 [Artemia franciscana]|uniref:Uncharacterized protein n=1 Tax=Artemia franciscana TaxID=6661 RepID=A0AA88I3Z4_ARTSF|nr:hypothetical protein QYM36_006528 [Artemia franciscana]